MAKLRVELEPNDWQAVLNYLSTAPYREVAPLIGRMSEQLKAAMPPANGQLPEQPQVQ